MNKFLDHVVKRVFGYTLVGNAEIERIVQQILVIGANIKQDGQRPVGVKAGAGHIQSQFSDGNTHPVSAQVTQAKDSAAIGNDNDIDGFLWPVG